MTDTKIEVVPDLKITSDNDIKTKLCIVCNETKTMGDFYEGRNQCKKCFYRRHIADRINGSSSYYKPRKTGIDKEKYDKIRNDFLREVTYCTEYFLYKKYGISVNAIRQWKKKGLIDEWIKQYKIKAPLS